MRRSRIPPPLKTLLRVTLWFGGLGALGVPAEACATDPLSAYEYSEWLAHSLALVEREYVAPANFEKLREGALRGMVESLDPHSAFLSREDVAIFEGDTSGRFGGVGLEVDFRGEDVVVIANVPGSPAARAKILPGDRILAIAGLRASELKPHEIVRKMRGPIGTKALLTIAQKTTGTTRDVALVREQIQVKSVDSKPLVGGGLYIHIKSFQDGTHDEFLAALRAHETHGASGILLDLRNNPGGLVREAVAIADEFLSGGVIFSLRARGATLREVRASSGGAASRGAVVVLVNEFSASAAELLAGALQDQKRAIIVGKTSFGKGSVQTLLPLRGGAALKLTTALYHTPSGETLQARGIAPDVVVDAEMDPLRSVPVVRERDIEGRIGPTKPELEGAVDLVPETDEELHLGVARDVPTDPRGGRDAALSVAFEVLIGDRAPRTPERPLSAPNSAGGRPDSRE